MNPVQRRMVLEREAENILLARGYQVVIVTDLFRNKQYIPYNLIAVKQYDDGSADRLAVRLRVTLHEITSLQDAKVVCSDDVRWLRKASARDPEASVDFRFEVWIPARPDSFRQFEITRDGIRETRPDEYRSAFRAGGAE